MNKESSHSTMYPLAAIFVIGLLSSLIIFVTNKLTQERIIKNKEMVTINMIEEVMPSKHDNNLYESRIDVPQLSTSAYRAKLGEVNVGLVLMPVSAIGYKGEISLAMGISYDGILSGVRIVEQQETEGLGDRIDQNKSNWVYHFDQRSLTNTENDAWEETKNGSDFDQLSGATISSRGVINAVKKNLEYYQMNRDFLFK